VSTFGGSELGCVAALAVLDQVNAPGFLERVRAQAKRFGEGLLGLPFNLRQRGLMMGLAFSAPRGGLFAAKLLYDAGVFTVWAGNDDSVLQFLPPLILTNEQVEDLLRVIRGAFGQ
jgi:acetylornithine/succinyldiaminopimelate/putrescine aminotransferase